MKKRKGFTLMEIMIVVSVISLLASLGTYAVVKSIRDSRIKTAKSELEMIAAAVLQMAWDTGKWPNGASRIAGASGANEIWDLSTSVIMETPTDGTYSDWKGPYYGGAVEDPWGNNYFFDSDYMVDGKNRIVVGSFGPNGRGRNIYDDDNVYVFVDD